MRIALIMVVNLICYHKNLYNIYEVEWINQFRESVLNQTYKNFRIYEINYGGGTERIFENSNFESKEMPTFIHAMNYLIEKALDDGAEVIGNLNCDDWYSLDRLEVQLPYIEQGYDLVASNFCLVKDNKIIKFHLFDKMNIQKEFDRGHNIISHPSILGSKNFWTNNKYIPEQFPEEDFELWKRTINDYKFIIVPHNLLFHRIHDNSVCKSENR